MKVNSVNLNSKKKCYGEKQSLAFKGAKTPVDIAQSVFFLEQQLLKKRHLPIIKDPTIRAKFEPKKKGKTFGDVIIFDN